ncbi:DUF4215 domain-containing protein [Enhygromyxa salina]|uniref:Multiple EGF-like-domain protein 3 n=1 Tax=Enhygromyxa salina TaxID=215803 RepID=A0A2S9YIP1_9BACT|nr:DUF4215 domain-containing protein [Enhygromyxa salina]PRQ04912.1 hypothetical protein ENSA7_48430 [Enhygromyxa salina]
MPGRSSPYTARCFVLPVLLCSLACTDDTTVANAGTSGETDTGNADESGDGDGDPGDGDGDAVEECGNGVVEGDEECDDGDSDNTDNCLDNCLESTCGDGYVGPGEGCDDGNMVDDDACTNTCALASCGDGMVQVGEGCDDGNTDNTDECLNTCVVASCGDGHVWAGFEACDDGNADNTDDCPELCAHATCGDGYTWADNEECDDANLNSTDACTETCESAECGDGHIWAGNEECDDANDDNTDNCVLGCVEAICGDGYLGPGEGCDDGNAVDEDQCTNACALATCGDGVLHPGESCDDGDLDNTDACLNTCVNASCGDGYTWANNEECDDGNANNTDACPETCIAAYCGDGFEYANVEDCDDNNDNDNDACSSQCANAICGDGFLWLGLEECDDGNMVGGDGCSQICTTEPNPPNNWLFRTNTWGGRSDHRFRTIVNLADDDVWFLGQSVVHFDGSWLTSYEVPFGQGLWMLDHAVTPEGDIWATEIQKMYHYDGSGWAVVDFEQPYNVEGVWRSPTGVIWIGAEDGIILRRTIINTWEEVPCPVVEDVSSLWGTDDDNIWAVTTSGTVLRWDGNTWAIDDQVNQGFVRIRGIDENNIQAVTSTGIQREWDGQIWKNVGLPTYAYYDIWWPAPGKRCTVGGNEFDEGYMSCFNGNFWEHVKPASTTDWIDTMTELDDQRRVATDEEGGIQSLSPQSGWLTEVPLSDQFSFPMRGAWRRSDDDIWAVSSTTGRVVHYDGSDWTQTQNLNTGELLRIDGFGNTGWIARPIGLMWKFDGNAWIPQNVPVATVQISSLEIFAEGQGWATGSSGGVYRLLRLQNNIWSDATVPGLNGGRVYAIDTDNAYMLSGAATLYHWNGSDWAVVPNIPLDNNASFSAIEGTGPDNIWIVGGNDTVLQWDGLDWTEHDISPNPFTPENLNVLGLDETGDVWTRAMVSNEIFHYHQGQWSVRTLPFLESSLATVRASDNSRWWIGGRFLETRN